MGILEKEFRALIFLSVFHIFVICLSNYLVQFPFQINCYFFTVNTTPAAFTFPLIFLATDLTVRVFGACLARRIITVVMIPALILSYIISMIFYNGDFVGVSGLNGFNMDVFRISAASFAAYAVGQLSDIFIFNRLRTGAVWWVAPGASTIFGSAVDTFIFFFVSFYHASDAFMAANWLNIGFIDYITKIAISLLFFLPTYGMILNWILKKIKA